MKCCFVIVRRRERETEILFPTEKSNFLSKCLPLEENFSLKERKEEISEIQLFNVEVGRICGVFDF